MSDVQHPRRRMTERQKREAALKKAFEERQLGKANHAQSVAGASKAATPSGRVADATLNATPTDKTSPTDNATRHDRVPPNDEAAPNDRANSRGRKTRWLPYLSLSTCLYILVAALSLIGVRLLRIGCFASVPSLPARWVDERQRIYNMSERFNFEEVEVLQFLSQFKSFADAIPSEEERIGRYVYEQLFPSIMVATDRMRTCQFSELLLQARMELKCNQFRTLDQDLAQTLAYIAPLVKRLEQAPSRTQPYLTHVLSVWNAQASSSSSLIKSVRDMSGTATRVDVQPEMERLDASMQTSKDRSRNMEMAKQLIGREETNWKSLLEELEYARQEVKRWMHDGCAKHPPEHVLETFRVQFCSDLRSLFSGLSKHKLCR